MVKICDNIYTNEKYNEYFLKYQFSLSPFQKHAIEGIIESNHVLVTAHTGSGKCLGINTPILMFDGTIKMVQHIKIGEQIMGDDSLPRNILSICKGKEQMYSINSNKGYSFKCNESHILSLKILNNRTVKKYTTNNITYWVLKYFNKQEFKWEYINCDTVESATHFLKNISYTDDIIDISVKKYLKLPKSIIKILRYYKVGVEFPEKYLQVDPYIIGLWLGNNYSVKKFVENISVPNINVFINIIRNFNLEDKYIPMIYKINSKENRLKLLAGFIDSTGKLTNNIYEFIHKNQNLTNDIIFLAQSLGLDVYKKTQENIIKIFIIGCNTVQIPVIKTKNKKTNYIKQSKDILTSKFNIIPINDIDYYGFTIDGNNRFLLGDFTVTHNTLVGEFAIEHIIASGKKVVYTTPIKALSNQKYSEFITKFPNISIGILTGDIKINPGADVLIMTSEILLNKLYNPKKKDTFDIDIENELGCVIMDEVHYINDKERGKIWEETIMTLPLNIQIVMLSATLDSPQEFARWCENRGGNKDKIVYLTTTSERVVPLTHYSFITVHNGFYKKIKDKILRKEIESITNKLCVIQDSKNLFNTSTFDKNEKILKLFKLNNINIQRSFVINEVLKYCVSSEILPVLCFVLSRKNLELCAKEVTVNLLETGSKIPNIINNECEKILRRLPNYKEYINLPEYLNIISLLKKGIAIHHAGIIPVLREMIEILYSKGYIKVLFATETFAVGINMPTKTVIFTDIKKFDGNESRFFQSHEYNQMSGRAGRRGIDTVGYVIHLNNLFKNIDLVTYKKILSGKPQILESKFKVSYNLLLNLMNNENTDFLTFVNKSMIKNEIEKYTDQLKKEKELEIKKLDIYINTDKNKLIYPKNIVEEYTELLSKKSTSVNKNKKDIINQINEIINEYKFINDDMLKLQLLTNKEKYIDDLESELIKMSKYIETSINITLEILESDKFVIKEKDSIKLSLKGVIASNFREIHCLIFSDLIDKKIITSLNSKQLTLLFSCFTNIHVSDEVKDFEPKSDDLILNNIILNINDMYTTYYNKELENGINSGLDYNIHFNLLKYISEWIECKDDIQCKMVLNKLDIEKNIGLGDFIKALLKINNITSEISNIAELIGDICFVNTLSEISSKTLKYVAIQQSLYI